jgi:hypothetical protein
MRLGCTPDEGPDFVIPAMAQVGDEDDRDDSMMMVAVRPGAALRARPSDSSRIIARLRWDVVTLRDGGTRDAWLRATLDDGRRGYIRRDLFRRFDDYSAVFAQQDGRWRMISFSGIE